MVSVDVVKCVQVLVEDVCGYGVVLFVGLYMDGVIVQFVIVDGVMFVMWLYNEELFGFVVMVVCVDGDEEVICLVNDSEYGLLVVVFSCDVLCVM